MQKGKVCLERQDSQKFLKCQECRYYGDCHGSQKCKNAVIEKNAKNSIYTIVSSNAKRAKNAKIA